jgi:hypothetical protein
MLRGGRSDNSIFHEARDGRNQARLCLQAQSEIPTGSTFAFCAIFQTRQRTKANSTATYLLKILKDISAANSAIKIGDFREIQVLCDAPAEDHLRLPHQLSIFDQICTFKR